MIADRTSSVTYANTEILDSGLSLFESASTRLSSLNMKTLEKLGDISAELLPNTYGRVSKSMTVIARLFWALAGTKEKLIMGNARLEDIEREIESLKIRLALTEGAQ
ncbi:MAG: hypothetical protein QXQ02_00605 [Halobacteria archaeon]